MTANNEPSDARSAETNSFASENPPAGASAPKAKTPRVSKRKTKTPQTPVEPATKKEWPTEDKEVTPETEDAFNKDFGRLQTSGEALVVLDRDSQAPRYAFLQNVYILVMRWSLPDIEKECRSQQLPWTKATSANPYSAVIRATNRDIDPQVASNYSIALQYIRARRCRPQGVVAFLKKNGGVQTCVQAFRKAKKDARIAKGEPAQTVIPVSQLILTGVPSTLTGQLIMTLKISDGHAEYISHKRAKRSPDTSAKLADTHHLVAFLRQISPIPVRQDWAPLPVWRRHPLGSRRSHLGQS